jgi:hypothetical protein
MPEYIHVSGIYYNSPDISNNNIVVTLFNNYFDAKYPQYAYTFLYGRFTYTHWQIDNDNNECFAGISNSILNRLNYDPTCYIILDISAEGFSPFARPYFQWIYNSCKKRGIAPNKVIYITGNVKDEENHELYISSTNVESHINILYLPIFELSNSYDKNFKKEIAYDRLQETKKRTFNLHEDKLFSSLSRRNRVFRSVGTMLLFNSELRSSAIISHDACPEFKFEMFNKYIPELTTEQYLLWNKSLPLIADYTDFNTNWACEPPPERIHNSTIFQLVNETEQDTYHRTALFYSEKTFRPIGMFQPFLIFGQQHCNKYLETLGYKTYEDWFDMSFDSEEDIVLRYRKILNTLIDTCNYLKSLPKEKKIEWRFANEDVLIHNYVMSITGQKTNELVANFVDNLIKKNNPNNQIVYIKERNNVQKVNPKRFFAVGCSFTSFLWPTWADILSVELNVPYYNYGKSGAGNHYIANMVSQIIVHHNLNKDDLIVICWSSISREDRILKGGWTTPGNLFTQSVYNENFINNYVDIYGNLIRDLALIDLVRRALDTTGVKYVFCSMADIDEIAREWYSDDVTTSDYIDKLLVRYSDTLSLFHKSFMSFLWNNDLNVKNTRNINKHNASTRDGHPDLEEHLKYLTTELGFTISNKVSQIVYKLDSELMEYFINTKSNNDLTDNWIYHRPYSNEINTLCKNKLQINNLADINYGILTGTNDAVSGSSNRDIPMKNTLLAKKLRAHLSSLNKITKITASTLHIWNNPDWTFMTNEGLLTYLSSKKNECVYYLAAEEHSAPQGSVLQPQSISSVIEKRNINLRLVVGFDKRSIQNTAFLHIYNKPNIDIKFWYTYWFQAPIAFYLRNLTDADRPYNNEDVVKSMMFNSLNNKPHLHRCIFMDQLAKLDLINNNLISWLLPNESSFNWQYWKEELLKHDAEGHSNFYSSLPLGYYNTLLDVVVESTPDIIFWTEKTTKPLLLERPFAILGEKNINKLLINLGFELFDELFEYSFDDAETIEERARLLAIELSSLAERIETIDRESLRRKGRRNLENLFRLLKHKVEVPAFVYDENNNAVQYKQQLESSVAAILNIDYYRDIYDRQ